MGSIETPSSLEAYSVPAETRKLLQEGIFNNPKIAKDLPKGVSDFASRIHFTGSKLPNIPINWRFTESAAALKAFEACLVAELVKRKYGVDIESADINVDHAVLFSMSPMIWTLAGQKSVSDPEQAPMGLAVADGLTDKIPQHNFHYPKPSKYWAAVTNIYETKDGQWFHLHASLNPEPSLESIGLPLEPADPTAETDWTKARDTIAAQVKTIESADMQHRAADVYKQAGVISNTVDQFRKSEHGRANAHVGLFEIHDVDSGHGPSWWPSTPQTSAQRPLAGLKVVDLCRIIAAPAVTRGLAELGASVIRVTSPNQPDFSSLHPDLSWGKWCTHIDLKAPGGVEKLKTLILDADVVIQGYRPGVFDKYGFSQDNIIQLVSKDRDRGIISVRENCYGWHGPWQSRSGWQQISDACVGISHRFGAAMGLGHDEPVTPVFPNSDFQTGVAGVLGVLTALLRRADLGGSYKVDIALNYYNQWLADSVGEYPAAVWDEVWARNGRKVFRAGDNMAVTVPAYVDMLRQSARDVVFDPRFFEDRESKAVGLTFHTVRPIVKYKGDVVRPGFNVGCRGNGKDAPRWPEDLMTEVVV